MATRVLAQGTGEIAMTFSQTENAGRGVGLQKRVSFGSVKRTIEMELSC